jgi:hypothetical protein
MSADLQVAAVGALYLFVAVTILVIAVTILAWISLHRRKILMLRRGANIPRVFKMLTAPTPAAMTSIAVVTEENQKE